MKKKKGKKKPNYHTRKFGLCPKCHEMKNLTVHHILPKRFFGVGFQTILLCRECHDELEKLIPLKKKLDEWDYYIILQEFLTSN